MKLTNVKLMYAQNNVYKTQIDTIWAMGYIMCWDYNIDPNIVMEIMEKIVGKFVAEEIMSAIIEDQKVFE